MTQVRLDLTKELSTLDKVRMIRDAQRQVGPGGRVEILAFKDDPIWSHLPRLEKERQVNHWTDRY